METKTVGKFKIEIEQDPDPLHPRKDWDNLGTMACFHRRYTLGDEGHGIKSEDYNGWDAMRAAIEKMDAAVILPIYMLDHSGLTVATKPFHCPWDSGQIGFIYVTREKLRKEFSKKRVSKQLIAKAAKQLEAEVEAYDQFLRGDVWVYAIKDEDEVIESCGGFFGIDECRKEAEAVAKRLAETVTA